MNKFRYLQSYELLTVILNYYRTHIPATQDFLLKIASVLDDHYSCDEFMAILNSAKALKPSESASEDNLFVDFSHIFLQYSNLQILSFIERISIYSCALQWFKQFNYTDGSTEQLESLIKIDHTQINALKLFFSETEYEANLGSDEIFILKNAQTGTDELEGDWIDSNKPAGTETEDHYVLKALPSPIKVLYIHAVKIFMIQCSDVKKSLSKNTIPSVFGWELIGPGDFFQVDDRPRIDYYDLKNRYLKQNCDQKLALNIQNLSYTYPNGKGIRKFSLSAEPGTLTGIIGVEGSGKSTFLQLLAGELTGTNGDIFINGYSLKREQYLLKGMIGFVPEDDLLFNELTVYENLIIPASLYLGKESTEVIEKKVNNLLAELGIKNIKNTVVGSVKDKNLQPGQRRLINIALELLRDPPILIVDNSLTPLSQSDSSKIIEILLNYSYKGRIVFTSITQTDLDTFAWFDRLFVLDEGGFPIYYGKSRDAWDYFCKHFELPVNPFKKIGPESIIHLINTKTDSAVSFKSQRHFSPLDLYNKNTELTKSEQRSTNTWKLLPKNLLHPPTLDRQYIIFSLRNFKTKLARSRELIFTSLIAPVLAILLSLALHRSSGADYNFSTNENIPIFFFLSILFAILFGLIQSVNEIYKERNIIKKQEYLNLSRFSYINSKITYLFIIGLIQSFLYIVIAHYILEIKAMFLMNWLILFSSFSFGILLGLFFSKTHQSLETIYSRSIPLVIILQLLFGGGIIDPEPTRSTSKNYTMLFSDLMVARWAYEAAMIYQFRNNRYQKNFFNLDRKYTLSEVNTNYLIPVLRAQLIYCRDHFDEKHDTVQNLLKSLNYNLELLASNHDIFPYENIQKLTLDEFDKELASDAQEYLEYLEFYFSTLMERMKNEKNILEQKLIDSLGSDFLNKLKTAHYNYAVANRVTKNNINEPIKYFNNIPIQISYPIYQYPRSDFGRAQMFLPEKQFSGERVDTIEFNISIIWLINLLLYILLITNIINKNP